MADSVSARAFTVGRDVHFARGQYRPGSVEGDALIAHELVHVAQQGARAVAPGTDISIGSVESSSERQAESIARSPGGTARSVERSSPHVARAPAVETKEMQGIELTEAKIASAHGEGFWEPLLKTVYDVQRFDASRWATDPEERDAIGAEAWAQHLMLQPLTSVVNILRVLPPRVPGSKPLLYRLQFEPAPAGRRGSPAGKPALRIQFVAEGADASATNAPSPTSAAQRPATISEADFPTGGFTAFMAAFPGEVDQLFNWVNTLAPQGGFSRVVHTSTPSTGHETSVLVSGTKKGAVTSNIEVRFLAFAAQTGIGKPGWYSYRYGYREKDRIDFELEERQARKSGKLGTITGVDTLPPGERPAVKYAILQYFENGTRNAEVDAIVPIPGGKRNMLYKIRFEPRTNDVRVRVVGEEGKDVVLDAAKRKLDISRVNGFDPKADATTLKSWISNRYKGVSPTGTTPAEIARNTNAKLDAEAGTKNWFANNYAMPVLDERDGDARLKTIGLHTQQRASMKHYEPPELRLMEISLELLSDAVLDVVRGTALARQAADISRKFVPASGGRTAHWVYTTLPDTAGQTWARAGGDSTIVMYDRMSLLDRALFAGGRSASGVGDAVAFGAMAVVHELGHVAAVSGNTIGEFNARFADQKSRVHAAPVTRYAARSPAGEFFPEAFAIYNTDPQWMLDNIPAMHAWFGQLSAKGSMP